MAGVRAFDPALNLVGVILNRVASDGHLAAVVPAIECEVGVPVLGVVRRDEGLRLPERYLGLGRQACTLQYPNVVTRLPTHGERVSPAWPDVVRLHHRGSPMGMPV